MGEEGKGKGFTPHFLQFTPHWVGGKGAFPFWIASAIATAITAATATATAIATAIINTNRPS